KKMASTVDFRVARGNYWGNDGFGFFFQRNWNLQPANTRRRAPANTINRCNSAGGKTRHTARRPHGRSGSNLEELTVGHDPVASPRPGLLRNWAPASSCPTAQHRSPPTSFSRRNWDGHGSSLRP